MSVVPLPAKTAFLRNALVLGLLTAIGPFAIDMYLPSLPSIGASLSAGPDAVSMSLTAFFVTFAVGQLVYGPVSDMIGRKPPLYFGIVLFAGASLGCALSNDIQTLILFRALQGIGGAAGMIIARAIVRDLHSGLDEVRLLSLLMLVLSVSPILAPLVGSLIIGAASWRGVFWLVGGVSVIGFLFSVFLVCETRTPAMRAETSLASMLSASLVLLRDRNFLGLTFIGAFGIAGFFVFLANSSFVFVEQYGLSPMGYGLFFGINALAFFAATQFNGRLGARFGMHRIIRPAAAGYAMATAALLALTGLGVDSLAVLVALLFVAFGFLGLVLPMSSVLALTEHGAIAGTASSLMGALQLAVGTVVIAIAGLLANGSALTMVVGIAGCAGVTWLLAMITPAAGAVVGAPQAQVQ
jgi:DHA1 family bicyclomycin/chloramphenicol resistance-like MFS transporter